MATATLTDILTDLHGKMMAKAEELWARAEATGCKEEQEAEQCEACAMVAEECAGLVAAASATPPTGDPAATPGETGGGK